MACIAKRRSRYVIDFYDNKGKRRWKTLPKGTTKSKARRVLREIEEKIDKGIYIAPKKLPYFSGVADICGYRPKSPISDIVHTHSMWGI